jgi:hypothetical protein
MSSEEVFIFVFGLIVTAICIGPYMVLAFYEFNQSKDKE